MFARHCRFVRFTSLPKATFPNLVVAFAGNPQLTTKAAYFPSAEPGPLRQQDYIQKGRHGFFAGMCSILGHANLSAIGETNSKQLLLLTLPMLLAIHITTVCVIVLQHRGSRSKFKAIQDYACPCGDKPAHRNPRQTMYRLFGSVFVLCMVGFGLLLLNLYTHGIFDEHGCIDGVGRSTISSVEMGTAFQWLWASFNCLVTGIIIHMLCCLRLSSHGDRPQKLHRWVLSLMNQSTLDRRETAVQSWRNQMFIAPKSRGRALCRRVLWWVLQVLFVCMASIPAIGYVSASGFNYLVTVILGAGTECTI